MGLFRKNKLRFPTFAIVLLIVGVIWLLNELDILPWKDIPWIPLVLIIIAVGMIINRYNCC
ncbi:MAG: hypothetical protein Q8N99_05735 [Nanoarchaeota archaeon]|nr:hypothetical protein [Nanoarchaeota archaeon]